jgi:hypothetical protein
MVYKEPKHAGILKYVYIYAWIIFNFLIILTV